MTFYVIFVMKTFLKDFSTSNLVVSTLYQMSIFKAGKTSLFRILVQSNLPKAIYISFVLFLRMHSLGVWNGNVNINKKVFFGFFFSESHLNYFPFVNNILNKKKYLFYFIFACFLKFLFFVRNNSWGGYTWFPVRF